MNTRVVTRITINAEKAEFFKYLSHLKYHLLWNPHIRSISSNKTLKLGSSYKTVSEVVGVSLEANNEVVGFVPDQELIIENRFGLLKYRAHYRLVPKNGATIVKCSTSLSTSSNAFVFTMPLLKKLAMRELRTDLESLKIAVENKLS